MSLTMDRSSETRSGEQRRAGRQVGGMPVSLFGFNLVALAAVAGPAWLILRSTCAAATLPPEVFGAVAGLFAAGVVACAGSMLLLTLRRGRRQGLALLLPGALAAFALALGLLFGLSA